MTEENLQQTFDIQLNPDIDELKRVSGFELRDALLCAQKPVKKSVLTWIDFTQDRDVWRMIVLNNFKIKPVIHEHAFARNTIERLVPIPRRPERTKKNQRNKLPKLYAIWKGAPKEGLRPKLLKKIVDSWVKCKPMVFKVPGAQYISATNNAAGRRHLEAWLVAHGMYDISEADKVTLRKDGKRYTAPAGVGQQRRKEKKKKKKRK